MPQELALVGELTVKETVFYFGNIFQVNSEKLSERYKTIRDLLELPPDYQRVENCSGGEKRRISFAISIIHKPDLLILDEPTVGLDPLLRENMWTYLWNVTRATKLSVIITTHYLAEARKADRIGFMQNGKLLMEDSPSNVMSQYMVTNLEDAFLACCLNKRPRETVEANSEQDSFGQSDGMIILEGNNDTKSVETNLFRAQVIGALFCKHWTQIVRQPA